MLYRIALVQTGSRDEAGDMVQQTLLKLLEHREELADSDYLKAWLIRVCVNQCKNHRNTAWKRKVHLTNEEEMDMPQTAGLGALVPGSGETTGGKWRWLSNSNGNDLYLIASEEIGICLSGQRSAEETIGIIQNRVQLYLDENK